MNNLHLLVAPDAGLVEKRAFFDAVKSKACVHMAYRVASLRAQLADAEGARGVLAEHIALGVVEEVALCERLTAEAAALGRLVSEARAGNAALDEFIKTARLKFAQQTCQAVRTELDVGNVEIPDIEGRIRGYERARALHRERLLEAGLADGQIDGADLLKPNSEELARWRRDLEARHEQVRRAKAFIASDPLFDLDLLDGGAHAVC
ncbi:hypothetical protein B0G81_3964 [Paraburkholderia sp. BL6665CI2N2]|uniref:hypothetical protein n=1 Tax=Paraburkholderia sp. BL6665CI2N2 TaxID=1938806 RepID=UPI0010649372|nr:hypothetical protein [Paraburkholderia sp. BL6665CI2N2]TDY23582.1 hypothetical protein B0G81_3964 [Paraburkholderia sp. BL6665CI2N2]